MTTPSDDPQARLRRSVYLLLILLSTGVMLGRILAVDSVDKLALEDSRIRKILGRHETLADYVDWKRRDLINQGLHGARLEQELQRARELKAAQLEEVRLRRPFLSANDRSRWCTVRALVEPEMRVIETQQDGSRSWVPYAIDRVIQEPTWDTIDMVKHDGHLYSSKPPLFPTLMAAEYWVIYRLTGAIRGAPMSLGTHPYAVGWIMLITFNVIPLLVYLLLLARLVERFGTTDWGRCFVMGAATFGTFLTTFAVTINNHLPAAVSALVALYAAVRIWFDGQRRLRYFVVAGLFAAFTAANELPALALFAALTAALLWKAPRQTILGYAPPALVVAAGFFGTNWIAHHSLRPPYMHSGPASKRVPDAADPQAERPWQPTKLSEVNLAELEKSTDEHDWYDYYYVRNGMVYRSHWVQRTGRDRGEPRVAVYALNVLVGHHGIFSLTPVWLISAAGAAVWLRQRRDRRLRELALLIAAVSIVCVVFYLIRSQVDRNYGGMTSGFRWMFWFAPLWLVLMLPAADAMASRWWTRLIALVMLVASVLSASYPTWNPWTSPWVVDYLHYLGWAG